MLEGSCLCGAVTFGVVEPLHAPDGCHCTACRKHSGHFFVSADVPKAALTVRGDDRITWFQSSPKVRRGFCAVCGSSLFWDPIERDWIGVAMGAFDTPTDTKIAVHVYTGEKGDYYDFGDDAPKFETVPPRPGVPK